MAASMFLLLIPFCLAFAQAQTTINTEIEIAGQKFQVSFPSSVSAAAAGQDFCVRNANSLGLTDDTVMNCIGPVTEYFQKVINAQQINVDVVTVQLDIDGTRYQIAFPPSTTTPRDAAIDFCVKNAAAFGLVDSTLVNCATPVFERLQAALQKSVAEREAKGAAIPQFLTVPLDIAGNKFEVTFACPDGPECDELHQPRCAVPPDRFGSVCQQAESRCCCCLGCAQCSNVSDYVGRCG